MTEQTKNSGRAEVRKNLNAIQKQSKYVSNVLYILFIITGLVAILTLSVSILVVSGVLPKDLNVPVFTSFVTNVKTSVFLSLEFGTALTYGLVGIVIAFTSLSLYFLKSTTRDWAMGKSPFDIKYIKHLRYLSLGVMLTFQPIIALFGLLIFVFSYLMQYGSSLEDMFKSTIESHEAVILSMAEVIEAKSGQTGSHVKRVSEYSKIIAQGLNLDVDTIDEIRIASMLHDMGKLLVPPEILDKPGKLTDSEFDEIKKHTTHGRNLLLNTKGDVFEKAKIIAYEHHEKWDGSGYAGKSGEDISLESRIVAVADVYDALVSNRSYKKAWSSKDAKDEIIKSSGSHFDPLIVDVFKKNYAEIDSVRKKYSSI